MFLLGFAGRRMMIKWGRIFFLEWPRRRCKWRGIRKVWQDDDNLKT